MDSPPMKKEDIDQELIEELANRPRYKSFRKKYRKMKIHFDECMEEANDLFTMEHRARQIARRLQEQNDQLLEILLEVNESKETPAAAKYDLHSPSLGSARTDLTPDSILESEKTHPAKSLAELEATTTHTASQLPSPSALPDDLQELESGLPGYLTPSQEDHMITRIDDAIHLMDPLYKIHVLDLLPTELASLRPAWPHELSREPKEPDFALDNPVSVHNWLRVNHPELYDGSGLGGKDKEDEVGETRPVVRSGRGKKSKETKLAKQDLPFKDLDEEFEFDTRMEEDEIGVAPSGGGGSGRRRKKEDDAYRPKGGHSKSTKRKREKDDGGIEGKVGKRARKALDGGG